jgi:bifunctional UDP-N-acetylglucosamine pyrophosphorylase/glucosamine-1-phosphate N-acetyltransferase
MAAKRTPDTWAIIMMAGMGTRMKSEAPKVLHQVCGQPMGRWVLDACDKAGIKRRVVVIGHQAANVREEFPRETFILQKPQRGTGHAVMIGVKSVPESAPTVLVLSGDVPCLAAETIKSLLRHHRKLVARATVLSFCPPDPTGYGRIIRDDHGDFVSIVEQADLRGAQRECMECNSGIYVFDRAALADALKRIRPNRLSGEYHLPDVIRLIAHSGGLVDAAMVADWMEAMGVNTRVELADAGEYLRWRIAEAHMLKGVTIVDPETTWIGPRVKLEPDTIIQPGSILLGDTRVGQGSVIGPYTELSDARIGNRCVIRHSVLTGCRADDDVTVGPFAHIRPGSRLRKGSRIGDFVELKKTDFGEGSKAGHLTYLGDAVIGKKVNVGAGTITCNYDGKRKHVTRVGDRVFLGSDSILVAPIKIGNDAYTAAGSTLNQDVPPCALAFGRAKQMIKERWVKK